MSTVTEASTSPRGEGRAPAGEHPRKRASSAINLAQLVAALPMAARKLDPRLMWRNPVMFIVEVGAALTTLLAIVEPFLGGPARSGGGDVPASFTVGIAFWLWLTVIFANLAEAVAEGRGKAQADSLRQTRTSTIANLVAGYDEAADAAAERATVSAVSSADLTLGDTVIVTAGELVPGDGDIVWGIASIDESAITGESAPVVRESGGDRSAVTGGTRVLSDRIVVRITSKPGETFVDRMIALVEGASRQKTPNELALNILLASLSIVFLVVTLTLNPIAGYSAAAVSLPVLVALLVCLIPTTIGALLSAIGIAGMDRLVQRNVLAMSGRAVEAAGDVTILLLDKTGTITYGNRQAREFTPLAGVDRGELINAAALSSLSDPTPEGKSIVDLAIETGFGNPGILDAVVVPFTAQTRMSGIDLPDGSFVRKGAGSAVLAWVSETTNVESTILDDLNATVERISELGGTPLVVAEGSAAGNTADNSADLGPGARRILGVVYLKDIVKEGIAERFAELRSMGIRTIMVTGDNPLTAKTIAAEAGVDDFLAEATPEDKLALIRREQEGGNLVAMTGDGTNDAPALAQADVGVAMNTGTSAAKEAGNMVDLDSDPTKLIDIVRIGKQLLITRGALTTFSIANDIAKYFAIIPAMFAGVFPGLAVLNVMQLHSPASAILSAIIFNAIIIVVLIPLALRGVTYRPAAAASVLSRNLLIYGLGGVIAPFLGIKLVDLFVALLPGF
ncbi:MULTISPECIES: potassium-transporting ATPase subunit KdpB [Cryobacterium]|uniref:Potassium-transporting ATPase ATP-binding subunit n=1 Tax=Cryobacterium glucosi TaxID=1259175 RepID=A0ABY2IRQ2_9MICO|nr:MULTISPECIES: potassium-transporting ATPase subunit KdpB [Cryobacterium]TFC00225.1 potassium-transporting ATPase subunit KdpB [Cryobacterium sp. MDB2-A-1]TFC10261.1 potassium-transporting ATPase subunit KdpB [Cryobacterium sp. MDB2-33-2]TFC13292.1 potassium-transporting ATPase subunit KdpB [Cryobacterium sp. MDB2-10]TFC14089.1 potassium-transporting ATPase subunit KdpB [Cryobacterium sp. MDB2-A-2]TFC22411.1 potassium-transporting ATPase subunit KdpB [Cryobacterium glucosi]